VLFPNPASFEKPGFCFSTTPDGSIRKLKSECLRKIKIQSTKMRAYVAKA
jgi:hypothetical protein